MTRSINDDWLLLQNSIEGRGSRITIKKNSIEGRGSRNMIKKNSIEGRGCILVVLEPDPSTGSDDEKEKNHARRWQFALIETSFKLKRRPC